MPNGAKKKKRGREEDPINKLEESKSVNKNGGEKRTVDFFWWSEHLS